MQQFNELLTFLKWVRTRTFAKEECFEELFLNKVLLAVAAKIGGADSPYAYAVTPEGFFYSFDESNSAGITNSSGMCLRGCISNGAMPNQGKPYCVPFYGIEQYYVLGWRYDPEAMYREYEGADDVIRFYDILNNGATYEELLCSLPEQLANTYDLDEMDSEQEERMLLDMEFYLAESDEIYESINGGQKLGNDNVFAETFLFGDFAVLGDREAISEHTEDIMQFILDAYINASSSVDLFILEFKNLLYLEQFFESHPEHEAVDLFNECMDVFNSIPTICFKPFWITDGNIKRLVFTRGFVERKEKRLNFSYSSLRPDFYLAFFLLDYIYRYVSVK